MVYRSEGGENIKFKHKNNFCFKNKKYIYIGIMFLHFPNHF
jgi:hypothetical protein